MDLNDDEDLLRNTIDSSMDMIQVFKSVRNSNGEIIDFIWVLNNKASEAIYGKVIGKSLLTLNPGVIQEGIFDTFKTVVETGQPNQSTRRYTHEQFDGWYLQSAVRQGDGVATTTKDITDIKKAEQALHQSKILLQEIIDAPNIGMAVYKAVRNADGRIIDFVHESINRMTKETLGQDFTGKLLSDHGQAGLSQIDKFRETIESGRRNEYIRPLDLSGQLRWLSFSNSSLAEDRLLHTWQDISDLKNAELESMESKKLVQTVFDVTLNPIAYYKSVRDADGRIIDFEFQLENREARKYALEDRTGQRYSEAYPGIRDTQVFRLYCDVVDTGVQINTEVQLSLKGTERWFHLMAVKLGDGLVATAMDITERKNAEQEIISLKDEIAYQATKKYHLFREVTNDRNLFLLKLSDRLRQLSDPEQIAGETTHLLREHLNTGWCYYSQFGEDQTTATVLRDSSEVGLPSMAGLHDLRDVPLFLDHMKEGRVMSEPDFKRCRLINQHVIERYTNLQMLSVLAVPVVAAGRLLSVLIIADTQERQWEDGAVTLVKEVAERIWTAVEKAKAEQAVRESEEKYRTLFMSMDEGYFVAEPIFSNDNQVIDVLFVEANEAAKRIAGLDFTDLRMREIDPEYEQYWYDLYSSVILTGEPVREIRYASPHKRWFEFSLSRVEGLNSRRVGVIFQDITQRKNAELALNDSKKRFQSIANLVPDLLWDSQPDGSTNWYNQRWLEYTGQSFDQAIGWGRVEAIHPADREASEKRYKAAVAAGIHLQQEHRIRRYDGEYRWFVVNASPLIDADGKVIKMYGSATDIHDRREAEQQTLANERQQAFLLQLSDAIRPLLSAEDIQGTAARLLRETLDTGWCYYNGFDERGTVATILIDDVRDGLSTMAGIYDLSASPKFIDFLTQGEAFSAPEIANYPLFSQKAIDHYASLGMRSALGVPLVKEGRLLALLLVADTCRRDWSPEEFNLIKEVAERTWSATVRAQAETSLKAMQANYLLKLERKVQDRTAELQESRDQLRSLLDTTLVQMSILKAVRNEQGEVIDLEIMAVNHELEKETGRSDLIGKFYAAEYPGIRESGLFDLIVKTIDTGEPQGTEYFYTHEGFQKWFSCIFVKFADGVVATNMDISARKRAEEERFKNYVLLRQSEEIASIGTWDFDLSTGSFTWSDGMYRLFDLIKGTQVMPEIYLEYTTESGRAAAERTVANIRSGNTEFEETLELNITGNIKVLHIKAAVVRNDAGQTERALGVNLDISAIRRAEGKIRQMEAAQNLEIFRTSLSTLEEERYRISESLHNGIGQILYGVKINMSALRQDISLPEFKQNKDYVNKLLTDAIVETRRISHELMPTTLEQFGLKSAIDDVCRQLSGEVNFICQISGLHRRMEKYLELAVYRTVQELMANVVKHAKASRCLVNISIGQKEIRISVADNGRGMDTEPIHKPGIGMASIRSKIKLLNGDLQITTAAEQGTTINITIPKP